MIVWPCAGPKRSACKIRRSSVPWSSSIRSRVPLDILGGPSIGGTPRMSRWESDDLRLSLPDGPWEVPGKHFADADKNVYVLTSDRTFSAAEDFTYGVKNLKRATI